MAFLRGWAARLIEPAISVSGLAARRQTRLVNTLLLTLILMLPFVVLQRMEGAPLSETLRDPQIYIFLLLLACLLITYRLSVTGRYRVAAAITIVIINFGIFSLAVSDLIFALYYVFVPLLLCSVIFSLRTTLLLVVSNLMLMAAYGLFVANAPIDDLPFIWMTTSSAAILLVTHHRNQLENDRRTQAAEADARYRQIVDMAQEGIWLIDGNGHTTFVNDRFTQMTGYSYNDMMGRSFQEFMKPEEVAGGQEAFERRSRGIGEVSEFLFTRKDGTTLLTLVVTSSLRDQQGNFIGAMAMLTDISERKEAELQRLELAIEHERVQMLHRFFGDISHDLRTPLTIIKASLYLIDKTTDPTRRQQHLVKLEKQAERLEALVEQLFTMSRLDATQAEQYQFEAADLNALVQQVIDDSQPLIELKQHQVTFTPDPALPQVLIDRDEFRRVVEQLLVNAINYAPNQVTIDIRTYQENEHIVYEVRDSGIGIKAEDLESIFERFYRVDQARSSVTGRMGLGLSIARLITDAHGGKITVESTPNQGSTFRVSLPVQKP